MALAATAWPVSFQCPSWGYSNLLPARDRSRGSVPFRASAEISAPSDCVPLNADEGWARNVPERIGVKVHEIAQREGFDLASGTTHRGTYRAYGSPEGPATPVISVALDGAIIPRHHRDGLLNSSAPLVRSRPAAMALRETGGEVGGAPPMLGSQAPPTSAAA
jgi:hypothetical protein